MCGKSITHESHVPTKTRRKGKKILNSTTFGSNKQTNQKITVFVPEKFYVT